MGKNRIDVFTPPFHNIYPTIIISLIQKSVNWRAFILQSLSKVGKMVRGLPLIYGQPAQKLMICLIPEHCIFHTPFPDSLTTNSLLGVLQTFFGCILHLILSDQMAG